MFFCWLLQTGMAADQVLIVPDDGDLESLVTQLSTEDGRHLIWLRAQNHTGHVDISPGSWESLEIRGVSGDLVTLTSDRDDGYFQFTSGTEVTLRDVTLDGNDTFRAIHLGDADLLMERVEIQNTATVGHGGAIWINHGSSRLTLRDSFLHDSSISGNGGFISATSGDFIEIEDTVFDGAVAGLAGGAIHLSGGVDLEMRGGAILNTSTSGTGDAGGLNFRGGELDLWGVAFMDTSSGGDRGGAIHLENLDTTNDIARISNCLFDTNEETTGNRGGGAVYLESGDTLRLERNRFCGNLAVEDGGAVYLRSGTIVSFRNLYRYNIADEDGGGVYVNGGTFTSIHDTFDGNDSGSSGEAIYRNGGTVSRSAAILMNHDDGDLSGVNSQGTSLDWNNGSVNSGDYNVDPQLPADACTWEAYTPTCVNTDVMGRADDGLSFGAVMDCIGPDLAPADTLPDDDQDDDGLPDFVEFALGTDPSDPDTDQDGLPDGVECLQLEPSFENGGFEWSGVAPDIEGVVANADFPGWNHDVGDIQVFDATSGVTPYGGILFGEVQTTGDGWLYQDLLIPPGTEIYWTFQYHPRHYADLNDEQLEFLIGNPENATFFVQEQIDKQTVAGWQKFEGTYTVPVGQGKTQFAFNSVGATPDATGNYLDAVFVGPLNDTDLDGIINCLDDDSDGDMLLDGDEVLAGSDPLQVDTDGDGHSDFDDSRPLEPDLDGDGVHGSEGDCDDLDPLVVDPQTFYFDSDDDGYGVLNVSEVSCVPTAQYVPDAGDCAPTDAMVHPGAAEVCDGIDNNCDTLLLPAEMDPDADGFNVCPGPLVDCGPNDPTIYPGADEVCDGVDQDCDSDPDNGDADLTVWYRDFDGDGQGDPFTTAMGCPAPGGHVENNTDCDDGDALIGVGMMERCNGLDDDCDTDIDEGVAPNKVYYPDRDLDGYGETLAGVLGCIEPPHHILDSGDCDDTDASINPDAVELCDTVDRNCDGDPIFQATNTSLFYLDSDGDLFGDPLEEVDVCFAPPSYVENNEDCNDGSADALPGGVEICDLLDNDCNGTVDGPDAADAGEWFPDNDNDGFGAGSSLIQCSQPANHELDNTDCDDSETTTFPGAPEQCNGVDDDCDGVIDNDVLVQTWTLDTDGDGFGDEGGATIDNCERPDGYTLQTGDCAPNDAQINPNTVEVCDGIDDNCSGDESDAEIGTAFLFLDGDGDGFGVTGTGDARCPDPLTLAETGGDCNDADPLINPGALEECDGIDNDCNGLADDQALELELFERDEDNDGYGNPQEIEAFCEGLILLGWVPADTDDDCDDTEPTINPGAVEVCDGIDNDCDLLIDDVDPNVLATSWFLDADTDGFGTGDATFSCLQPDGRVENADDCDDTDTNVNPAAVEQCGGVDENCDDLLDVGAEDLLVFVDCDLDGVFVLGAPGTQCAELEICEPLEVVDCDDANADRSPDGVEVCDGIDNDCDGEVDEDLTDAACAEAPVTATGCTCDGTSGSTSWLWLGLGALALRRRAA